MEDEIDLRKYILLLVNHWRWIVGLTLLLMGAAFFYSQWVLSPTYSAKAILFIVQPQYSINFDARFTTQNKTDLLFYGPVDTLAKADDIVQELYDAWLQEGKLALTAQEIKGMLSVEDSTPSSIELLVTSEDPEISAKLVNLWATILVQRIENVYTNKASEADNLLDQFTQAKTERETAQQALVDFQGQNELLLLQAELSVTQTTYAQFLVTQADITQGLENVESLQTQISGLPLEAEMSFANELTALLLQIKVYDTDRLILINIDAQPLTSTQTVREMQTHLEQLSNVLIQREQQIALKLEPLQVKALELQSQISAAQITEEQLNQRYKIASDTYLTLARKLEETKIFNEVTTGSVRLASQAIVPLSPSGPNTLLNTLLAGVFGVFLSVSGIFGRSIWKEMSQPSPTPSV